MVRKVRAQIGLLDEIERRRPVLRPWPQIGAEQDVDAVVDVLRARASSRRAGGGRGSARHRRRSGIAPGPSSARRSMRSVSVAVTPCRILRRRRSVSVLKRSSPGAWPRQSAAAPARDRPGRTGSCATGVIAMVCARGAARHPALDLPPGQAFGPDDQAGAVRRQAGGADRRPRCRIWRYISMVRALMPRALGTMAVPGWRSTSSERMPCCDSSMRGGEPDRAAADDQHGDVEHGVRFGHCGRPIPICRAMPRCIANPRSR